MTTLTTNKTKSFVALNHELVKEAIASSLPEATIQTYSRPSHTKVAASVGGGDKVFYRICLKDKIEITKNDIVQPMLQLRDQTFPGAALSVNLGLFRQVCSNGLMAFAAEQTPIRIPHFNNRKGQLEALVENMALSLKNLEATVKTAQMLTTIEVKNPIQTVEKLELPKSLTETITWKIHNGSHRSEDNPHTAWGLYNIVNEIDAQHSRSKYAAMLRDTAVLGKILAAV